MVFLDSRFFWALMVWVLFLRSLVLLKVLLKNGLFWGTILEPIQAAWFAGCQVMPASFKTTHRIF